ncbi:MAG: TetR/AcrR family transcriptional regulator [Ignavibacteria bacterium]|jgi:TetR/AcrR family fatty acid metabolism transcriptional regulator
MRVREGDKETDILNAAITLFAEQGFHKTRISQIAEQANVAVGSIYLYFKNKDDIINKIFEKLWQRLYLESKKIADNTLLQPSMKVDGMIDSIINIFTENPNLAILYVNEQNNLLTNGKDISTKYYNKILDVAEIIMKEGIEKNAFVKDIDIHIFRHYVFGAIRNLLHLWGKYPEEISIINFKQTVKYLTKYGVVKAQ